MTGGEEICANCPKGRNRHSVHSRACPALQGRLREPLVRFTMASNLKYWVVDNKAGGKRPMAAIVTHKRHNMLELEALRSEHFCVAQVKSGRDEIYLVSEY